MTTYFISDIHLHADSKIQANLLLNFLNTHARNADAIYILGDLFAIWLGDDLHEPYSQELIAALVKLSAQKVPLYFMRGNRDFLVNKEFCKASGCTLLPDPCKINLYGQEILLTHGDLLCTLDQSYQRFRRIVQNPLLKNIFLMLPIKWRKKLGMWIKRKANNAPQNPSAYDVEQSTVNTWFNKFAVKMIIHGHTHRPAIHKIEQTTRIVLGDWNTSSAKILAFKPHDYELIELI